MILRVSKQVPHRDEVAELVRWGISAVLEPADRKLVGVNVKSRPPRVRWEWEYRGQRYVAHTRKAAHAAMERQGVVHGERHASHHLGFSGRAYSWVPYRANWPRSVRYLITMHVPQRLGDIEYPRLNDAVKRVPIMATCWQEEVVGVAAHEARHIYQYRYDKQRSEVDCQRKALWAIERWRAEQ